MPNIEKDTAVSMYRRLYSLHMEEGALLDLWLQNPEDKDAEGRYFASSNARSKALSDLHVYAIQHRLRFKAIVAAAQLPESRELLHDLGWDAPYAASVGWPQVISETLAARGVPCLPNSRRT